MIMVALSIFDSKAEFFCPPFFVRTEAEGKRMFLESCQDSNTSLSQHPDDFRLYVVGSWDDSSGSMIPLSPVSFICDGSILIV